MRITLLTVSAWKLAPQPTFQLDSALAKTPNFKQEKQRREDMKKKRNEAKQREQAARKEIPPAPLKP
jgi:hypothetical protein